MCIEKIAVVVCINPDLSERDLVALGATESATHLQRADDWLDNFSDSEEFTGCIFRIDERKKR